jgi:hypothetical protein
MFKQQDHPTDEELICFVDNELSPRAANRMQAHLDLCADCRSRKEQFDNATSQLAALHRVAADQHLQTETDPHAAFKAQLDAARNAAPKSPLERSSSRSWIYLYAAVAIVALSLTALDQRGRLFKLQSMPSQVESRLLPDSGLTPGATRPVGLADICPEQDNDLDPDVSSSIKQAVFEEYGITGAPSGDYQVDYLINPQLGGTGDVRNLWPEPYGSKVWNARLKDALEDRLHNMVCAQQIDLADAQRAIATDWIAAYKKYFHTANPA